MTIGKKELTQAPALSCIEYYFLAWLKKYYPIEKLYFNSYISAEKVFRDFLNGAKYESYTEIERIQDTAEQCGVTVHNFYRTDADTAERIICSQADDTLCLMRAGDAFFEGSKRRAWREDHYISVDKQLAWLNEYPLTEGKFDRETFRRAYGGAILLYRLKDLSSAPKSKITVTVDMQGNKNFLSFGEEEFEEALGILRVSRKRLEAFYAEREKIREVLHAENSFLDKVYFIVHMRRMRGTIGRDILCDMLGQIFERENKFAEAVSDYGQDM